MRGVGVEPQRLFVPSTALVQDQPRLPALDTLGQAQRLSMAQPMLSIGSALMAERSALTVLYQCCGALVLVEAEPSALSAQPLFSTQPKAQPKAQPLSAETSLLSLGSA